jgi:hypothetical protein
VVLNSVILLTQFFMLKEEGTGRFIDVRFYDLYEMALYPKASAVAALKSVFEQFRSTRFPSIRHQLDKNFDARYEEFWEPQMKNSQTRLWPVLSTPVAPAEVRLRFDQAVCNALGVEMPEEDSRRVYNVIVREMMLTQRLASD